MNRRRKKDEVELTEGSEQNQFIRLKNTFFNLKMFLRNKAKFIQCLLRNLLFLKLLSIFSIFIKLKLIL